MANTKELRRRIKSVKNTSQITKAMQMVSATKMRKAQTQALGGRPYSMTLSEIIGLCKAKAQSGGHELTKSNSSRNTGVAIFTSDKGLAGALNANIFRKILTEPILQGEGIKVFTVGKKGREFIVRIGKQLEADFPNPEKAEFRQAKLLRKILIEAFLSENVGEVYLLYPSFKSTLRQEPVLIKILPIDIYSTGDEENQNEFLYEPTPDKVLDFALIHHIETQIFQALLETKASEHSARMVAMQNATDNAKALVEDLQLTYNQVRQSAITTQILEIASAASALE